ncbi:hypothetical protein H0H92_003462, partial [Tricholoma furcatifolium]
LTIVATLAQVNCQRKSATPHLIKSEKPYIKATASLILGPDFRFTSSFILDDNERTGLAVYDELTTILPIQSAQSIFFWRKLGKPLASMLDTADFPISVQISFLTYIYARVLGMMGPLDPMGPASYMTYDGSPVELSWVVPSRAMPGDGNKGRHVRFAFEPIDPRSGTLLRGSEVLRYLTSPKGGLGLVNCDEGVLDWSIITEQFLYSTDCGPERRFFVGFDFLRSGRIVLKAYYIPRAHDECILYKSSRPSLWSVDYAPLRSLIMHLDATLLSSLNTLIEYAETEDTPFKPRLQILSMDCVPNKENRLKVYCRPLRGTSWHDARRAFTLAGRLDCPEMDRAISRLEILWNLLFPFAHSRGHCDLDDGLKLYRAGGEDVNHRRSVDHPTRGLLFYYCLIPGSEIILPKRKPWNNSTPLAMDEDLKTLVG